MVHRVTRPSSCGSCEVKRYVRVLHNDHASGSASLRSPSPWIMLSLFCCFISTYNTPRWMLLRVVKDMFINRRSNPWKLKQSCLYSLKILLMWVSPIGPRTSEFEWGCGHQPRVGMGVRRCSSPAGRGSWVARCTQLWRLCVVDRCVQCGRSW